MGASLYLSLAVACIAAITGQALGQSYCTTVSWGNLSSTPHPIATAVLDPEIRDWNINIPVPPECTQDSISGVSITGCDYDKVPQLKFLDKLLVYFHRNGRLHHEATATATVYCAPSYQSAPKHMKWEPSPWEDNSWQHKGGAGLVAVPN